MMKYTLSIIIIGAVTVLFQSTIIHAEEELNKQTMEEQEKSAGKTIRVAAAQIPVTRDIAENVKTITRSIDWAIAENADILLTPEGSLSGLYT